MDLRENKPLTPMESGCSITHLTLNVTRKCNLGCSYCNPAGTPILMADETYKPIEEVQVGDQVMGFGRIAVPIYILGPRQLYVGKQLAEVKGIGNRIDNLIEVTTEFGSFRCTADHQWFGSQGYLPAEVGMEIGYVDGNRVYPAIIESITAIEDNPVTVYGLETSTGNYIAHGYTSKNCFSKCYTEYDEVDMSLETAKKTVDWLMLSSTSGDAKKLDISFWGGEPLLRWDLIQQIAPYATLRAAEVGKEVTFGGTTNVTLLTEDKFDFMDKYNIRFLLSIDGIKKHHDMFRTYKDGTGSWDIIQKRIPAILKRWPQAQVRLSFTEDNVHELIDDLNYFYELGFKGIVYSPVSEGEWAQDKLDILDKVWSDVADWYVMHPDVHMKFVEDGCSANLGRTFTGPPCGAARHYVGVDYDGSIHSCHRFIKFNDTRPWYEKETALGHIDYGILNQSWRERFIKWTADDINNDCGDCPAYKVSCSGGCWATNYDIMGDIGTIPPMNCHLSRTTLEQGKKVIKLLGPQKAFRFKTNTGFGQEGCTCFNIKDTIHGKIEIDLDNPNLCQCDMAHYGQRSDYSTCPCYNVADDNRGIFDRRALVKPEYKRQDSCTSDCQK